VRHQAREHQHLLPVEEDWIKSHRRGPSCEEAGRVGSGRGAVVWESEDDKTRV
jgi:hypothetical protein